MARNVKIAVSRTELDENGNTVTNNTDTIITSFDSKIVGQFTIVSKSTFQSIDFGSVTEASVVILDSEEELVVKLNGGTQEFKKTSLTLVGKLSQIEVKNLSENESEIRYEVYGS